MLFVTEDSVQEIYVDHISNKIIDVLVGDTHPLKANLPFAVTSMGLYLEGKNFYGWHEGFLNYSLHFTLSGCGVIRYGNQEYIIKPGAVFFKNNRQKQQFYTYEDHWKFCYINCVGSSTMIFDKLLNPNDKLNIVYSLNINELFNNFIEINELLQEQDILSTIKASNIINEMLTELLSSYMQNQPDTRLLRCPDWIVEAKEYIDNNFMDKLNVIDLANMYHVSEAYFIRSFKKYFDCTPKTYIINKRFNEAKNLLLTTNDSINEIAYKVGFPSHSLFTQGFKKMFGCTPTDFRNIQQ